MVTRTEHIGDSYGYVHQFLSLRCAGDVLNTVPRMNKAAKEISRAMTFVARLRYKTLRYPNGYDILDLCSGNCLTGVLLAYTLPVSHVQLVDMKKNPLRGNSNRISYHRMDIFSKDIYKLIGYSTIITVPNAPGRLAERAIEIYNNSPACGIMLMTGKVGKLKRKEDRDLPATAQDGAWHAQLCKDMKDWVSAYVDTNCIPFPTAMLIGEKDDTK